MDLKRIFWPPGLSSLKEMEHHQDLHIALNYCLTYYTCALSSSHLTLFSFSLHLPTPLSHAPFFTPLIFLISFHSQLDAILVPPCFHLFSSCIAPSYLSILYANLSLCLPISLFSAPLRLAHYFCSIVHSVWGWTRTPPWPTVRGERLSGTKTSIAPFFFSLFISCDRW